MKKKTINKISLGALLLIISIAVMLGGCGSEPVGRHPNSDQSIDTELEIRIRQDFVNMSTRRPRLRMRDVWISTYFGTYNESSVATIGIDYRRIPPQPGGWGAIIIEGMNFAPGPDPLRVWNNGNFYGIENAYENGLLTIDDMRTIYAIIQEVLEDI